MLNRANIVSIRLLAVRLLISRYVRDVLLHIPYMHALAHVPRILVCHAVIRTVSYTRLSAKIDTASRSLLAAEPSLTRSPFPTRHACRQRSTYSG
jgi:hypothetical protein